MSEVASARWDLVEAEADARGLWTARRAAAELGVSYSMIRTWRRLGLIQDYATGGKGHPSMFSPEEVRSATSRRRNLRLGWRGRPLTEAERQANARLAKGIVPSVPHHLPYRALAYTCGTCGGLISPTSIYRSDTRVMQHHECDNAYARERRRTDPEYRDGDRSRSKARFGAAQQRTLARAGRRGYFWTGPEVDIALREDLTAEAAATMLGRTLAGVMWIRRQVAAGDLRKIHLQDNAAR